MIFKNRYIIETYETCRVWKQYSVDACTIEEAKEKIKSGEYDDGVEELDHFIDNDMGIGYMFLKVRHIGVTGEGNDE